MRNEMIMALLLVGVFTMAGCATTEYASVNPSWNPEQGMGWAQAQCSTKAEASSGYDWIDSMNRKQDTYKSCMRSYGYELTKVSRPTE